MLSGPVNYGYVTLQSIEAPINLTITPRVARQDNCVTCTLKPEVGDVTGTGPNNLPIITRRSVETTIRIGDGQIVAIGGLLQQVRQEIRRKIPFLGDLPLLGSLFRSTRTETNEREITIFIVPHILDDQGRFKGPLLFESESQGQLTGLESPR
jgi:type II secretory pathway component GspD/PulD (secretin)